MRKTRYGLGWKPQRPDHRDLRLTYSHHAVAALPATHSRLSGLPEIWDQGDLGSCTAHGILRVNSFAATKAGQQAQMLSRLMLYYDERVIEGTTESDAGAEIRDGIQTLVKNGSCLEAKWPYDVAKFASRPSDACYQEAMDHQAIKYAAVAASLDQIKAALNDGFPVVFGMTVFNSMMSDSVAKSGIVPIPGRRDPQVGGHCLAFNGFWDDTKQLLGFDNSWSTSWGDSGKGYLPYWFLQSGLVSDCWVIYSTEGAAPTPQPTPTPTPTPSPTPAPIGIGNIHIPAKVSDWLSIGIGP